MIENILINSKQNTSEEQKILTEFNVLKEFAKLSIKIDGLNSSDKVSLAKRLKELLNEYKIKINSVDVSEGVIALQIKDIVYIESEILANLKVIEFECDEISTNDVRKIRHDKVVEKLEKNLDAMMRESSCENYSTGGYQYMEKR